MALQTANQFQLGTDFSRLGAGVQQGQQIAGQFQLAQDRKDAAKRATEAAGVASGRATTRFEQEQSQIRGQALNRAASALKTLGVGQRSAALQQMAPELAKFNIDAAAFQGADLSDEELDSVLAQTQMFMDDPSLLTSAQREFKGLTKGLSEEDKAKARRIELGLDARVGESAAERIAKDKQTTEDVAKSQARIEELKSKGKAEGKGKGESVVAPLVAGAKAEIEKAVKLATSEAKAKGETITDLKKLNASLPGLQDVVGELKELATIATSTIGGNAFDFVSKEFGFGSTTGADAKSKFIAIIANQVLPLLKPTFGAAFTVAEGESLKATMGDPDVSPTQKIEQLNAFIEGKARAIQTAERELGQEVTPTSELTQISDEELLRRIEAARGSR